VRIVSSYVRHHQIGAGQLAGLIVDMHRTLASLGLRACPTHTGAAAAGGADPTLGAAGFGRLPRLRISRAGAAAPSAGRTWLRGRPISGPLEFTGGSPGDGTGLFCSYRWRSATNQLGY